MKSPIRRSALLLLLALVYGNGADAQCTARTLDCGASRTERLENATCTFSDGSQPIYIYYFNAFAGQILDIFLQSDDFPPLLVVYEPGQSAPDEFDSGTSIARVKYDVRRSGRYQIVAAANNGQRSGLFDLDIFCSTVCVKPFITSTFTSYTVAHGTSVGVSATADGTPPFTSWRWFDTTNPAVTIGTSAGSVITPPLTKNTTIGVTITNSCGSVTSLVAFVSVVACLPPTITRHPGATSVSLGQAAIFTVDASGSSPFAYFWYEGESPDASRQVASGSSVLQISHVTRDTSYWVRISNACGTADSLSARLEAVSKRRRSVRH